MSEFNLPNDPTSGLLSMEQSFNLTASLATIDKMKEDDLRAYTKSLLKLYVGREALLKQININKEVLYGDNTV